MNAETLAEHPDIEDAARGGRRRPDDRDPGRAQPAGRRRPRAGRGRRRRLPHRGRPDRLTATRRTVRSPLGVPPACRSARRRGATAARRGDRTILGMPPSSRHGRQPTFSKPIATVFWLVALGVVAVALLAEQRLAIQLAVAGALSASFMIWSVYDSALREARADTATSARCTPSSSAPPRTPPASTSARSPRSAPARAARGGSSQLDAGRGPRARDGAGRARRAGDVVRPLRGPTIVDMANRRDARPIALVRDDTPTARRARPTVLTPSGIALVATSPTTSVAGSAPRAQAAGRCLLRRPLPTLTCRHRPRRRTCCPGSPPCRRRGGRAAPR